MTSHRITRMAANALTCVGLMAPVAAYAQDPAPPPMTPPLSTDPPPKRLDIYGFAMLDAIYDMNSSHPDWQSTVRPSTIPVVCPGDPGCGEDGNTTLSVRQSRFGVKGYSPTPVGDLSTIFEFEMFGTGADAGQTTIRLRHAWGEIGQIGAGQTWSLFMDPDTFPDTVDYWGPVGMAFYRNAQLRWTPVNDGSSKFAVAIERPGAAIDAGKLPELDPSFAAGITSWDQFPDLTAQYRYGGDWGHIQISGIGRYLGVQGPDNYSEQLLGWGAMGGAVINISKDQLLLQVVYGYGIENYMNDGGVDLAPEDAGSGEGPTAVSCLGWHAYYNRTWNDKFTSSLGFSQNMQDNTAGQADSAMKLIQVGNVNFLYKPVPEFLIGPEFIYGSRENKNGDSASDMRIQVSAKYKFGATIANND
jgi:hypothetical protein